jgi:hypothetical protein
MRTGASIVVLEVLLVMYASVIRGEVKNWGNRVQQLFGINHFVA